MVEDFYFEREVRLKLGFGIRVTGDRKVFGQNVLSFSDCLNESAKLKSIRLEAEFCARSEYGFRIFVERLIYEL